MNDEKQNTKRKNNNVKHLINIHMRRKPKNCNKIETDKKCLKNITTFLLLLFFSGHFTNWLIGHNYPFSNYL